jgi:2-haloacid dehalogenase
MVKPDKEFYDYIINKHKLIPSETIFIDDNLSNIHGAKAVGLHSIQYINSELLREKLEKIGIL